MAENKAMSNVAKNAEKRNLNVTRIIDAPVEKVWKGMESLDRS